MRREKQTPSARARALGRRRCVPASVAATLAALALVTLGCGGGHGGGNVNSRAAPPPVGVGVSIDVRHPGAPVPQRFLGLSFELSSLGQIAAYGERGDLVELLRSLGPGVLRFGGVSADTRVAWSDRVTRRPRWASSVVGRRDLRRLRALAARSGWRVLLTIGLAHYDPRTAAREAAAAKAALGPWLAGIEVGNEPDAYAQHGLRRLPWTYAQYSAEVSSYRRAIARVAPGIALASPGVSGSRAFERWGPGVANRLRPALLTGHHYPLGCHDAPAPTIARLLSEQIHGQEADSLARYMSVARASGIGFRMDESNTVSCGGRPGISNTFASALWAARYIAETMVAGVAGINLQGNPTNCGGYTPLCAAAPKRLAAGLLRAQPEWYALLLTRALVGDRPVRATMLSTGGANVTVAALLAPGGGLRLLIVDDDPPGRGAAAVSLHVGRGFASTSVLSLTASSPRAQTGVRLAGTAVAADGSWRAPPGLPRIPVRDGVIALSVPPSSAALLELAPRPLGKR